MFINIVMATIVVALMLTGEDQSFLRTVECLHLMFILSCLGLATDHVPLFDSPEGVLEVSPHIANIVQMARRPIAHLKAVFLP